MSKEVKIILIVFGSLAAVVVVGVVSAIVLFAVSLSHSVGGSDAGSKARAAAKIANFTLPRGYRYVLAMDMGIVDMATIAPQDGRKGFVIQLEGMAMPTTGETDDQLVDSMQTGLGAGARCTGATTVGNETIATASGKSVSLRQIECGGSPARRVEFGKIPSGYPLAIFMAIGPPASFDENAVHELVRSIK